MAAPAHNLVHPALFEIPDPPAEFAQDGGKFYRCYDALAEEIDEDMTRGLKEQLDGLLIFAGLFAGVNSAFLALTLPLLSPDPADDTNALLLQNNLLLFQLAVGRNDSLPSNFPLPSTSFAPPSNVYTVNLLFALSMAFALIAAFIAGLGRQWLVYYRRRSGGGADHQRWEQLKRFLGAERWHLELILDDALPFLLQIALVIFCVSLVIYLRILNPGISGIVAIVLSVALAAFLITTLCTLWDRFCPFHSPLSHFLSWFAKSLRSWFRELKAIVRSLGSWVRRLRYSFSRLKLGLPKWTVVLKGARSFIRYGRKEDTVGFLQTNLVRRTICTSEDPVTLLYATANIPTMSGSYLQALWADNVFLERLFELGANASRSRFLAKTDETTRTAVATLRLYTSAIAHIIVAASRSDADAILPSVRLDGHMRNDASLWIPDHAVPKASPSFVRASLASFVLKARVPYRSDSCLQEFCYHLSIYSAALKTPNWALLCFISYSVSLIPTPIWQPFERVGKAYIGDFDFGLESIETAFTLLVEGRSLGTLDCNAVLTNMLHCINQIFLDEFSYFRPNTDRGFTLFKLSEVALRSSNISEEARSMGRILRTNALNLLRDRITSGIHRDSPSVLRLRLLSFFAQLQMLPQTEFSYQEDAEIVRIMPTFLEGIFSVRPDPIFPHWNAGIVELLQNREEIQSAFLEFKSFLDKETRRIQRGERRRRDPEVGWCYWQEWSANSSDNALRHTGGPELRE